GSTTDFTFQAANGCDSVVTVTVNTLPVFTSTLTLETCTGTSVGYNGQQLAPNSVTDFTLTSVAGCDSVVTVTVVELAVLSTSLDFDACTGSTVTYNGQTLQPGSMTDFSFTTANGCDSIVTVTVTEVSAFQENLAFDACTGTTVTYNGQTLQPGSVTDFNFTTAQGCDSIVTVTVNELPVFSSALTLQTCPGTTVTYNGQQLASNSVTDFTLTSSNGCDSVVTVTVDEIAVLTGSQQLQACTGETVFYSGQQLAAGSVTDFTFASSLGCDSVVTVTVAALPTFNSPLALQACPGSTVAYNGLNLSPGTNIPFTFTASNGCDSVVNVSVTAAPVFTTNLNLQACPGSTANYNGQPLQPNSVTNFNFTSSVGCDSTVIVTVTQLPTFASALTLQTCPGATVMYNGQALQANSMAVFTLTASNGCDSVVTVTVNEVAVITNDLTLQACEGTTVPYNGQTLQPGSVTDFTFVTPQGCDSIVTVTVVELFNTSNAVSLQACEGTTAAYNGQPLQPGSVTDFTFTNWQGCDSVVTVTVVELQVQTSTLQLQACEGTTVVYNGQTLQPGSVTDVVLTGNNGCDSTVTVTVQELAVLTGAVTLQGCQGETLTYQGTVIQPGSSVNFTFTSSNGCDSIVTVTALQPIPTVSTTELVEICEGGSALIFGQATSSPGDYSQTFTGSNGCDSTHTVTLAVANNLVLDFPSDVTIELGGTVVLDPIVFPPTGLMFNWQEDPTLSCLDCRNPTASPLLTTTYTLTVSDLEGCAATDSYTVFVDKSRGVYIPNSFSPNDDGFNDVFMIFSDGRSVKQIHSFLVFSRWGESVFQIYNTLPDDIAYGWNGTHRGEVLDVGVFVYFADIEFVDGVKRLYKGDVSLVR
ncbi:MAG: gliding motility-associated C-terminal domain-containing protein, partial [Bacteroidetes bacterium]|nr:gliding motility-associated C-terminal domain-containing protein [Bacteroidota bacterium]